MKPIKSMIAFATAMMFAQTAKYEGDPDTQILQSQFKIPRGKSRVDNEPSEWGSTTKEDDARRKGLQPFVYEGEVIYARNKKNADRKARNKGYKI